MVKELVVWDKVEATWGKVEAYPFVDEPRHKYLIVVRGSGAVALWKGGGYKVLVFDRQGRMKVYTDIRLGVKL